jgi:hypothetical protein
MNASERVNIHAEIGAAVCLGRELSEVLSFLKYHCAWNSHGKLLIAFAARRMELPIDRFVELVSVLSDLGFIKLDLSPSVIFYSISDHGENTA